MLFSPGGVGLPRIDWRVGTRITLFEACSAFTRVAACMLAKSPDVTLYTEGFSHFVTSITAPVASGWSTFAGWDSHPQESATFAWRTSNSGYPTYPPQSKSPPAAQFQALVPANQFPLGTYACEGRLCGSRIRRSQTTTKTEYPQE